MEAEVVDVTENQKIDIERQKIALQKQMVIIKVIEIEMKRRAYIRQNRSWADKIDDFFFGW